MLHVADLDLTFENRHEKDMNQERKPPYAFAWLSTLHRRLQRTHDFMVLIRT